MVYDDPRWIVTNAGEAKHARHDIEIQTYNGVPEAPPYPRGGDPSSCSATALRTGLVSEREGARASRPVDMLWL